MLRDRVEVAFARANELLVGGALEEVRRALALEHKRFRAQMRVAIVGRVSSGKSTLTNALLGVDRVATGVEELTFNVNWLKYGRHSGVEVHFRDGRPPERRDLTELRKLTVRAGADEQRHDYLSQIDYIVVTDPNPQLQKFDVIDTPGLDSYYGTDSDNTLRFLRRTGDEVRGASLAQAEGADALVLVFARGLAARDEELLSEFHGKGFAGADPITTVGALTKVELFWPDRDPLTEGRRVAEQIMGVAGARQLLFDMHPLASLVAAAAGSFTEGDFCALGTLASLSASDLSARLQFGPLFATTEYGDLPVSPVRRRALFERFGAYGIAVACELMRCGVQEPDELRSELVECSGLASFRRLLVEHFGNRSDLIKLQRVIRRAIRLRNEFEPRIEPRSRAALDEAVAEIARLEFSEHAFRELAVLRDHYDGRISLSCEDLNELLQVTGEHGTSLRDRLGLPHEASLEQVATRIRERRLFWARRAAEFAHSGPTRRAEQVIRRTYEQLEVDVRLGSGERS